MYMYTLLIIIFIMLTAVCKMRDQKLMTSLFCLSNYMYTKVMIEIANSLSHVIESGSERHPVYLFTDINTEVLTQL